MPIWNNVLRTSMMTYSYLTELAIDFSIINVYERFDWQLLILSYTDDFYATCISGKKVHFMFAFSKSCELIYTNSISTVIIHIEFVDQEKMITISDTLNKHKTNT